MTNIPTPHNSCANKDDIAKIVLMPGDPLRAKFIADTFLTNVKEFNHVRNMYGYTGYYNGKKISVMGSGMGMASIGIYSYELYKFYDVETIVRIGSAGAYSADLDVYDTVLVTKAWSESTFALAQNGYTTHEMTSNEEINNKLRENAKKLNINLKEACIHSSDVFYHEDAKIWEKVRDEHGCKAVEMESFALFTNALTLNKKAACLLTISDSFVTHVVTSAEERQKCFTNMMKLALSLAE